jgi:hypothetical protein
LATLDLYVVDDHPDERSGAGQPSHVLEDLVAARRRPLDRVFVRQLHAGAATATAAFDRWLAGCGGRVVARAATLRFDRPAWSEPGRLRVVGARLEPRRSALGVPVELELLAWGRWRSAVSLHPVASAWCEPRLPRYFGAGHAVMDVVTAALRDAVEVPA